MQATNPINLVPIPNCTIEVPGVNTINFNVLPEISDSKSASYSDEPIIGRSLPLKTYSHSENRAISWTAHFVVIQPGDVDTNLQYLRLIESLVYPQANQISPYSPPPIVNLQCGELLGSSPVCAILKNYSVKFPTDTSWDQKTCLPYKFDVEMQFEVVYNSQSLPGQETIMSAGV